MTTATPLVTRERLREVRYEIRGELARRARELEARGHMLIKLNIGNPGAFGFRAPEHMQDAIATNLPHSDAYTHQQGLPAAREAIASHYSHRDGQAVLPEQVFLGNGVSELIDIALRALLNHGDEVLLSPANVRMLDILLLAKDAREIHPQRRRAGVLRLPRREFGHGARSWRRSRSWSRRARSPLVVINPNNPTGA